MARASEFRIHHVGVACTRLSGGAFLAALAAAGCGRVGFESLSPLDDLLVVTQSSPGIESTSAPGSLGSSAPSGSSAQASASSSTAASTSSGISSASAMPAPSTSMSAGTSTAVPSPTCDQYGVPELLTGLPDGIARPSFSPDGLTLFFKVPGPDDFYTAVRSTSDALAFGDVTAVELVSTFEVYDPALSADGLRLYFAFGATSEPENTTLGLIARESETAPWSAANGPIQTNSPYRETAPWVRADELELLFTSDRPSTLGGENIWVATRPSPLDEFGGVLLVDTLSSDSDESASSLTADGLTVYFTSNRPGGLGQADVWTAERPSLQEPFRPAAHVAAVNSTANDSDPVPSKDGLELYFISDRNGTARAWRSRRGCI